MSVDGYIDDTSSTRLVLSNASDLERVNDLRASVDAIMVGANTIRRDNPRLLTHGGPKGPVKVTVTSSGNLDPTSNFFTTGTALKLVYAPSGVVAGLRSRLADLASVIDCGASVSFPWILADLEARGLHRLMVEGGSHLHTEFLTAGLAQELHLAVSPLFVGDPHAPRFVQSGHFAESMALAEARVMGDVVLLHYYLGQLAHDWNWLRLAFDLAKLCPPSDTALSVGCVIIDSSGNELSRGHSRDTDDKNHAEESALSRLDPLDPRLKTGTLYSSTEPCGERASRPLTCAQLIISSGIPRVVYGLPEPPIFVQAKGAKLLTESGIEVIELGSPQ
jgi:riboflavin-specific deaminase-like protein